MTRSSPVGGLRQNASMLCMSQLDTPVLLQGLVQQCCVRHSWAHLCCCKAKAAAVQVSLALQTLSDLPRCKLPVYSRANAQLRSRNASSDDASSKCTRPIGWLKANGHLMDVVECTSQPVFLWQCHSPKMPEVPRGNASAPHFTLSLDVLNNQTSVEASLSGDGHVQSLAVPSPQVGLCFYAHVAMQSSVGTYFRESIKKEERRAKQLSYASTEAEELRSFQAYCASLVLQ
eukprot:scaffold4027_cov20-Tisochrysis_lutea.AAC.2